MQDVSIKHFFEGIINSMDVSQVGYWRSWAGCRNHMIAQFLPSFLIIRIRGGEACEWDACTIRIVAPTLYVKPVPTYLLHMLPLKSKSSAIIARTVILPTPFHFYHQYQQAGPSLARSHSHNRSNEQGELIASSYRWTGLSLRNNWLKFKTSGKVPTILEDSIEYISQN